MKQAVLKNCGENPVQLNWGEWFLELKPGETSYPISETLASKFSNRISCLEMSSLDPSEQKEEPVEELKEENASDEEKEPVRKRRKRGES